ncbi:hypothetical protein PG993_005929 [Apiospora rasikravindrae]|uniref:Myb-like domain-containing protein n=1 Tax=Apiospora rasikravindrae TaxID=990691 RepID=A0ABR1TA63_9PEZI
MAPKRSQNQKGKKGKKPSSPNPPSGPKPADNMDKDLMLIMTAFEQHHPKFNVSNWAAIAAKRGLSDATAKIRFSKIRDRFIAVTKDATAINGEEDGPSANTTHLAPPAPAVGTSVVPPIRAARVTRATSRAIRGTKRARPVDEVDVEDDGDNVPSTRPALPAPSGPSIPSTSSRVTNKRQRRPRRAASEPKEDDEAEDWKTPSPTSSSEIPALPLRLPSLRNPSISHDEQIRQMDEASRARARWRQEFGQQEETARVHLRLPRWIERDQEEDGRAEQATSAPATSQSGRNQTGRTPPSHPGR